MKILFLTFFLCLTCQAQLTIGKNLPSNNSVSLEFGDNENLGLILPYVTNKDNITESGSLIYDVLDKKVKILDKNKNWIDYSIDNDGKVNLSSQQNFQSSANAGIKIGNKTDNSDGILVLTDSDKAMILPKVEDPHLKIVNPSAGMIVYDNKNKMLAIFNGNVWSFFKP